MSIQQNFDEHHFDEGSNQELNRKHVQDQLSRLMSTKYSSFSPQIAMIVGHLIEQKRKPEFYFSLMANLKDNNEEVPSILPLCLSIIYSSWILSRVPTITEKEKYLKFGIHFFRQYAKLRKKESSSKIEMKYNFARLMSLLKLNSHANAVYSEIINDKKNDTDLLTDVERECRIRAVFNQSQMLSGQAYFKGKHFDVHGVHSKTEVVKSECKIQAHVALMNNIII